MIVREHLYEHKTRSNQNKTGTNNICTTGNGKYRCEDKDLPANIKHRMDDEFGKHPTPEEEAAINKTKEFYKELPDGCKAYFVDIKPVRDISYGDFVEGGNEEAYPMFVPKGEIWIDKAFINDKDEPVEGNRPDQILVHEAIERKLMQEDPKREYYKETYKTRKSRDVKKEGAHEEANEVERQLRDGEISYEEAINKYYK